ncbi:redoxin domain-containing protein [Buchnera aphidicola (Kurisakia onigurumii)]|uniref:redoxin domain-containing protein n=1 Tax=Buchnera aphidicola TaxID=9 RepID=UPI0031B73490
MALVTLPAPNFTASAITGDGKIINNFNFKKYSMGFNTILFFWPMDFTFVCPTELIEFNKLYSEFEKRKIKIIGISCDSVFVHQAWRNTPINQGGIGKVNYTMVSDIKRKIQKLYEIEHPEIGVALRASFLIDKTGIVRHETINDLPFGRNIHEIIRMTDAINFFESNKEVCPANWNKGDEGIDPSLKGIKKYFKNK